MIGAHNRIMHPEQSTNHLTRAALQELVAEHLPNRGFQPVAGNMWRQHLGESELTVSILDGAPPCLKGQWTDGQCADLAFFDPCDGSAAGAREALFGMLVWVGWYAEGKRPTASGHGESKQHRQHELIWRTE